MAIGWGNLGREGSNLMKAKLLKGICPGCGKKLKIPFPYNVDLYRSDVIVICLGCGLHSKINFTVGPAWEKLGGKIQGIFHPPYKPEVPTLEELKRRTKIDGEGR